jgi:hypothetical protein
MHGGINRNNVEKEGGRNKRMTRGTRASICVEIEEEWMEFLIF